MSKSASVIILFSVIQVILTEKRQTIFRAPPECLKLPRFMNHAECCPLEPMYTDSELSECNYNPNQPPQDNIEEDCARKFCLLRNRGLLLHDDAIDYPKLKMFVEHWAENKTHILRGFDIAKQICFTDEFEEQEKMSYPICEPDRIFHCLTGHLLWNCELNVDYPGCDRLQVHMDNCRKYLYVEPY